MSPVVWAGIDIGKMHHHCVVLDAAGSTLLSRQVANDEPDLLQMLIDVLAFGGEVIWSVDVVGGIAALVIAVLVNNGQRVVFIPGRAVNRAVAGYRGQGKTDARDALGIADQAGMRRDLVPLRPGDDFITELRLLVTRRADSMESRNGAINACAVCLRGSFPLWSVPWT